MTRELLTTYKMTQQEAADLLGLTQPAVSQYNRESRGSKVKILSGEKDIMIMITDLTKDVYLVTFEPIGDFNPKTPQEFLKNFNENSYLRSEKEKIGGASFFRTKAIGNKLIGSFLTAYPEKMKEDIEKNPSLKLISIKKINPEIFIEYENSIQESLN